MKKTPTPPTATAPVETEEAKLVRALRGDRSFRDFETYLNENIPDGMPGTTTFQSAWNWQNGVHPVNDASLMAWMAFYSKDDPRHQLAIDILGLRVNHLPEITIPESKKVVRVLAAPKKSIKTLKAEA